MSAPQSNNSSTTVRLSPRQARRGTKEYLLLVLQIDVHSSIQQILEHFHMATIGSNMQRCVAGVVLQINVGSSFQQGLDELQVPKIGRNL